MMCNQNNNKVELTTKEREAIKIDGHLGFAEKLTSDANRMNELQMMIDAGALFVINHSAGKDSQAMFNFLMGVLPKEQVIVIHADLGEVEWHGNVEHIKKQIGDLPFFVTKAKKTFFDMVEHRQMFPSSQHRQCTSDLKRGPIQKVVRRYADEHGYKLIVNCMGLRAEESPNRAKQPVWKFNRSQTNGKRTWFEYLPIHDFTWADVLATEDHTWFELQTRRRLYREGYKEEAMDGWRFHDAYVRGMSRLSCCFCILANRHDLWVASKERPELFKKYVDTEKRIGHTMKHEAKRGQVFLDEYVAKEEEKQKANGYQIDHVHDDIESIPGPEDSPGVDAPCSW